MTGFFVFIVKNYSLYPSARKSIPIARGTRPRFSPQRKGWKKKQKKIPMATNIHPPIFGHFQATIVAARMIIVAVECIAVSHRKNPEPRSSMMNIPKKAARIRTSMRGR